MSEFDKISEDDYQRGDGVTNKLNDDMIGTTRNLPHHDEFVGPKKNYKHVGNFDHKKALVMSDSPTGIDLVHLSVDSEEHGKRLAKRLFSKALIAQADV
jgi:predicted N-acetyltransferase YhbS